MTGKELLEKLKECSEEVLNNPVSFQSFYETPVTIEEGIIGDLIHIERDVDYLLLEETEQRINGKSGKKTKKTHIVLTDDKNII